MAEHRLAIKTAAKRKLVKEVGGKCANPGCPTGRTHIHHIKEWAVYSAHLPEHMIALCPTCHDAAHHGRLIIADETLYAWKGLPRPETGVVTSQIFVEPSENIQLLCGQVALKTTLKNSELVAFNFSPSNKLGFRILDSDLMLLNLRITDRQDNLMLKIVDNYVREHKRNAVTVERRTGRIRVTAPAFVRFISTECLATMKVHDPTFADGGQLTILDVEVLAPGVVKTLGVWHDEERALIITEAGVHFWRPGYPRPTFISGMSFVVTGPLITSVFGFS